MEPPIEIHIDAHTWHNRTWKEVYEAMSFRQQSFFRNTIDRRQNESLWRALRERRLYTKPVKCGLGEHIAALSETYRLLPNKTQEYNGKAAAAEFMKNL